MNGASVWKNCFCNWPADVRAVRLAVAAFNEQIPFSGFAVGEDLVILDRRAPDSYGARKVVVPYAMIQAVKFTDVVARSAIRSP